MPSAETPTTLWIRVTRPDDEDREIELGEYASEKTMNILLDYCYHMPTVNKKNTAASKS